jgi:quercetin dioxygenase-like cupin family protein
MMKINEYYDLEEALHETMAKDIDHTLIRHSYIRETRIIPHVHRDNDEYVIVIEGHFRIISEEIQREFNLSGEKVTVIYYPAGQEHGLEVLSDKLDYFVLRTPKQ